MKTILEKAIIQKHPNLDNMTKEEIRLSMKVDSLEAELRGQKRLTEMIKAIYS